MIIAYYFYFVYGVHVHAEIHLNSIQSFFIFSKHAKNATRKNNMLQEEMADNRNEYFSSISLYIVYG